MNFCEISYEAPRVKEALSIRTIPGIIRTDTMNIGPVQPKCSVSKSAVAIWVDPIQQVALCETCYQHGQKGNRERSEEGNTGR